MGQPALTLCQCVLAAEEPLPDPAQALERLELTIADLLKAGLLRHSS